MNNAITQSAFLKLLRSKTMHLHTQLEQLSLPVSLTSPGITFQQYLSYLQLMYILHAGAEMNIYPVLKNVVADAEQRKKLKLIQQDLFYLNVNIPATNFLFDEEFYKENVAFCLGIMYVLEGSTLGGRLILNNIKKVLHLDEENGAAYFAGYKELTSEKWKSFLMYLISYESGNGEGASIIEGAEYAFGLIYNLMKKEAV